MSDECLTVVEFICECGQREQVRIEGAGYSVCYDGHVKCDWKHFPCPYQYDPRCISSRRHRRRVIQAFSRRVPHTDVAERSVQS